MYKTHEQKYMLVEIQKHIKHKDKKYKRQAQYVKEPKMNYVNT